MDGFERYEELQRLLRSCLRDQFWAKEKSMRDVFEERAMKRRLFYREKWPPLNPTMTWRSTRKALIRQPALKTFYFGENRAKLQALIPVEIPEDLLRRERTIREKIEQLPPVEIYKTELSAGSEQVLVSRNSARIYVPLSARRHSKRPEELGYLGAGLVANSLEDYANLASDPHSKELNVWSILRSAHFAENSHVSTEERAVVGYREEVFDYTKLEMTIVLSQAAFQSTDQMSGAWLSGAPEGQKRTALLTMDVPSDTHLIRRDLGTGEGKSFRSISCQRKKIVGFHLHLCSGSNEPVHSFALTESGERS